ncbi:MAG: hypothetical protein ACOYN3_03155 [Acidimicrobiia bacterium]
MTQLAPPESTPVESPTAPPRSGLFARIEGAGACAVGATWFVAYFIAGAIEPAPRDPAVMHAWYVAVINTVLLVALAVMIVGLAAARRIGLAASAVAATAFTAAVVACPITGHHTFGAWWFGELACVGAVWAVTGVALHRSHQEHGGN